MAVLGKNIIVYRGGVAIAGTRSNEVGSHADTIETASAATGEWRTFLPGRKDWSVTVGYLVLSEAGVADLLSVGSQYTLLFKGASGGVTGTAILQDCRITATVGSLVTGSFSFRGTGALTAN